MYSEEGNSVILTISKEELSAITKLDFDPNSTVVQLFGCCSYEETWRPGIEGWGKDDEESRKSGYVSAEDWDNLLAAYRRLCDRLNSGNPNYTPYQTGESK